MRRFRSSRVRWSSAKAGGARPVRAATQSLAWSQASWTCRVSVYMSGARRAFIRSRALSLAWAEPLSRIADRLSSIGTKLPAVMACIEIFIGACSKLLQIRDQAVAAGLDRLAEADRDGGIARGERIEARHHGPLGAAVRFLERHRDGASRRALLAHPVIGMLPDQPFRLLDLEEDEAHGQLAPIRKAHDVAPVA